MQGWFSGETAMNHANQPDWDVLLGALEERAGKILLRIKELCAIDVARLDVLADKIDLYIQAVNNLIQHRDKGIAYFREAAGDIDRAFKRVAAAKITGSGLGVVGGILGIVGGGLLLGGVTAPAGIPLVAISAVFGVSGAITGVGATIGKVVENKIAVKRANEWIHTGSDLCEDVINKHQIYHDELESICELFCKSEKNAIGLSIERKGLDVDVRMFQDADDKAKSIITEWTKARKVGSEGIATAVVAGTRVSGGVVRGAIGQSGVITRIAGQSGTLTRVAGQIGTVGRGVAAGAETGAAVARVAVQAAGGVVIGLSAAIIVVDLALISKTAYDINKNKKGTKLGKKLREVADDIERETETLRLLAHCSQC